MSDCGPCKGCEKRHHACHDSCRDYKAYKILCAVNKAKMDEEAKIKAYIAETRIRNANAFKNGARGVLHGK